MKARRDALAADVVVVNHHLFFADVVLRDEGVAELLPACNTLIFDEAHQLPDTARLFFGESVSTGAAGRARARRAPGAARGRAARRPTLDALAGKLDKAARDLRLALRRGRRAPGLGAGRGASRSSPARSARSQRALDAFAEALAAQAERCEGLGDLRAARAAKRGALLARLAATRARSEVRWVEVFGHALQLHVTPLVQRRALPPADGGRSRAPGSSPRRRSRSGEDFAHFTRRAGPGARRGARLAESVRLRAPGAALRAARPARRSERPRATPRRWSRPRCRCSQASRGRAFLLFTTLRALRRARELLRGRIEYPLLVQGEGSRSELLARFRSLGNAVLLGSASFWEGVDVRGEALSVVVIDKLPFAPPDDPVLAARIEALRAQRRQPVHRVPAAAGGAAAQAGRRPPDPRRARPRRADAVRPAPATRRPYGRRCAPACRR